MAEGQSSHHHLHNQPLVIHQTQNPTQHRSRGGGRLRTTAGEIVEVQGGHIVRSTGRKDRHSKVCTAKGPRDRRVRLSAHTAIQFYDVQDRLGYDRPSKAVDWLIKNAKAAIDELTELPAWYPTAMTLSAASPPTNSTTDTNPATAPMNQESGDRQIHYEFSAGGDGGGGSSFLPPSLDSDVIANTIKSFFPMAAAAGGGGDSSASTAAPSSSSPIGFQSYPPDLLSRTSSSGHNQDLRLSLQSFQDLDFHHQNSAQHQQHHQQQQQQQQQQSQWFDAASVMVPWAMAESSGGNAGGYVFNVQQQQLAMQQQAAALGQSQFFTQRGPLQSSNQPFVRAWADPMAAADNHLMQSAIHHSAAQSIGFASGSSSGFSGFRIPSRIQGEEGHDGSSDKPSSASSDSHR